MRYRSKTAKDCETSRAKSVSRENNVEGRKKYVKTDH